MKERNGFVSNSSSSSFMIIFAEILNLENEETQSFFMCNEEHELEKYVLTGQELLDNFKHRDSIVIDIDWGGAYHEVSKSDIDPNATYFLYKFIGNEGDWAFMKNEDAEVNYNIDIFFFDEDDKDLMFKDVNEKNGFKVLFKAFGAGRNG